MSLGTRLKFPLAKLQQLVLVLQAADGTKPGDASILVQTSTFEFGDIVFSEPPHSFDGEGRLVLRDLEKGMHVVRVSSPGFLTAEVKCRVPQPGPVVVRLTESVTIDAHVADPAGTPLSAAIVKAVLLPDGQRLGEYTKVNGRARLEKLKPGAYRVWAEDAAGRSSDSVVVDVRNGKPVSVGFTMRR